MGLFSSLTRKAGRAPAEHTRPAPVTPDLQAYAALHAYRTGNTADAGDVDGLIARAGALGRERGLVA